MVIDHNMRGANFEVLKISLREKAVETCNLNMSRRNGKRWLMLTRRCGGAGRPNREGGLNNAESSSHLQSASGTPVDCEAGEQKGQLRGAAIVAHERQCGGGYQVFFVRGQGCEQKGQPRQRGSRYFDNVDIASIMIGWTNAAGAYDQRTMNIAFTGVFVLSKRGHGIDSGR
jgi:hypothetical protein